ncbi:MAG: F0F1 ATP synthase subunit alpha [Planctomycetota bacterium]|jgi:F-type H+-transporting ATPase subunit alpha
MQIKTDEIVSVLKKEISTYQSKLSMDEVGTVLEVGDGIAQVYGLRKAMALEMVEFDNGSFGLIFNLEENSVGVVILGDYLTIKEGDGVKLTGRVLSVPSGKELIGRVVNPLGQPLDGKGPVKTTKTWPLEFTAPGVAQRQPVDIPLQTGIKAIDSMIPIGRGQRELIIGDRGTGKTAIAVDTIINQRDSGVICVYVAIGQKASTVASVVELFKKHGAMDHTIVVSSTSADPAPLQYIAPYSGCAMAEYFMYEEGLDTLCVYDDLTKQAQAYRQLSLLLRRPPGREAFPGDVFYLHSRLLERSARLKDVMDDKGNVKQKRGSQTALPIIETQEGEVSAYIPTNVISITDGQIYLEPDLFFGGIRPAVNVGISVSRVGGKAQIKAMKQAAGSLRLDLANFWELEAFAQLGTELDKEAMAKITRGKRMVEILKQGQAVPMPVEDQILIIHAGTSGVLDEVELSQIADFEEKLLAYMHETHSDVVDKIREKQEITDEIAEMLDRTVGQFGKAYLGEGTPDPRAATPDPRSSEPEKKDK